LRRRSKAISNLVQARLECFADSRRRLITVQRSFDGPTKSDHVRAVRADLDPLVPVLRGGAFGTLGG
jgi:hypothetical protein